MERKVDWKAVREALSRPFDPAEVGLKVQATNKDRTKGMVVAYVDARAVLDRLDDVVGPDGWTDAYYVYTSAREEDGTGIYEVSCRLTIFDITKEDVGEGDSLKAAYSDALKRAAVKFGIGRYLYFLPKVWADLDERGNIKNPEEVKARLLGQAKPEPLKEAPVQVVEDALPEGQTHLREQADTPPWEEKEPDLITTKQKQLIWVLMKQMDSEFPKRPKEEQAEDIRMVAEAALGREVDDPGKLTKAEASKVIEYLQELAGKF